MIRVEVIRLEDNIPYNDIILNDSFPNLGVRTILGPVNATSMNENCEYNTVQIYSGEKIEVVGFVLLPIGRKLCTNFTLEISWKLAGSPSGVEEGPPGLRAFRKFWAFHILV